MKNTKGMNSILNSHRQIYSNQSSAKVFIRITSRTYHKIKAHINRMLVITVTGSTSASLVLKNIFEILKTQRSYY